MVACIPFVFGACSTDPEDASEKHVYGPNETVYLRTDAKANIPLKLEFRKGKIAPKTIPTNKITKKLSILIP